MDCLWCNEPFDEEVAPSSYCGEDCRLAHSDSLGPGFGDPRGWGENQHVVAHLVDEDTT